MCSTGLDPNKVTDIDKAGESDDSEDSLPLDVSTAQTRQKTKRPSPPRARAFGSSPQSRPTGTGLGQDTTDGVTPSSPMNTDSQPQEGQRLPPGREQEDSEPPSLSDLSSLQRTKHGSPHPGRRRGQAKEGIYIQ